ncbi:hypothetical protein [Sapientia aquatica]|uniref:Uncharacterized protein n=1 Tax=Sapientia aquatica TaxID=1549640 RepID=A0A4R5VLY8_9BURK|nr:hypothetical protein [Sapientia aquatica]TDK58987.1 hypothetical protein E2I14_18995 [Sapientia aquatica]
MHNKPINQAGLKYLKFAVWLSALSLVTGLIALVFGLFKNEEHALYLGICMLPFAGWVGFMCHAVIREPVGVTGWRKYFIPDLFENSFQDDFLYQEQSNSRSKIHAAKRFAIFCFVSCFFLALWHFEKIDLSLSLGFLVILIFDFFVKRKEKQNK